MTKNKRKINKIALINNARGLARWRKYVAFHSLVALYGENMACVIMQDGDESVGGFRDEWMSSCSPDSLLSWVDTNYCDKWVSAYAHFYSYR
ncbi:hypothetical protein fHeYen301_5 [Yersinia phage fHe-Yen3-01]|uniref:Uncharacterized protein n=1 Tax=Yersinia phage fHe-Yen3-01 TaxID=1932893 RepID=A0A1L7DQE0_9CAUD|nr:hypothetical protein HOR56_gp05 [Yersinia phage fHe-Yen3-01]APU00338.1 hypothetical protein fHeYen301_5 [Yersinia phage fHe-Yen3-01]